jgi:hypothetical protein
LGFQPSIVFFIIIKGMEKKRFGFFITFSMSSKVSRLKGMNWKMSEEGLVLLLSQMMIIMVFGESRGKGG